MNTNQPTNYKILVVDDEPANVRLLERLFRREYHVITANSGAEALALLETHDAAVIVSDQRMPGMTGVEFLKRAAEMRPHTVRIVLTGYADINSLVEALNSGVVYKYVPKPWMNEDLQQTVVRAVEHYETIKNQYQIKLQNERLTEQLEANKNGFVSFVAEALDAQQKNLHEHLRRTSNYAVAVGQRLGLETAELEQLALVGFFHQIGRLFAPKSVVSAESAPPGEHHGNNKLGAERAARLLAKFSDMEDIAVAVRYFGEHFDGSAGDNLSGERIPLYARIAAAAAAYDLMTAPHASAAVLTHEQAVGKLRGEAGKRFDPSVIEALDDLEAASRIQQTIADGIIIMRLLHAHNPGDGESLSIAELLQKFKTEPMLAMDALYAANTTDGGEPTAKLIPAMSALGEENLRSIITQYGLPPNDERTRASSERAVRRAVAAQMLTAHTDLIHPDEAYTLGLLYDVGETLLLNLFPDEMLSLEHFDEKTRPRRQVGLFGMDAAQISRQMLEGCGIPANLAAAVENRQDAMSVVNPLSLLLRIADVIAGAETNGRNAAMNSVGGDLLEALNLSRGDLNKIYERANFISQERVEAPEQILELNY